MCAKPLRNIWTRECVRRIAKTFQPRGRSAKSGRGDHRAKIEFAFAGYERGVLRVTTTPGSAGRFYQHSESPHACHRRTLAEFKFRTAFENSGGNDSVIRRSS